MEHINKLNVSLLSQKSKSGIFDGPPLLSTFKDACNNLDWAAPIDKEYSKLLLRKACSCVPSSENGTAVPYKCSFRKKLERLVKISCIRWDVLLVGDYKKKEHSSIEMCFIPHWSTCMLEFSAASNRAVALSFQEQRPFYYIVLRCWWCCIPINQSKTASTFLKQYWRQLLLLNYIRFNFHSLNRISSGHRTRYLLTRNSIWKNFLNVLARTNTILFGNHFMLISISSEDKKTNQSSELSITRNLALSLGFLRIYETARALT